MHFCRLCAGSSLTGGGRLSTAPHTVSALSVLPTPASTPPLYNHPKADTFLGPILQMSKTEVTSLFQPRVLELALLARCPPLLSLVLGGGGWEAQGPLTEDPSIPGKLGGLTSQPTA